MDLVLFHPNDMIHTQTIGKLYTAVTLAIVITGLICEKTENTIP